MSRMQAIAAEPPTRKITGQSKRVSRKAVIPPPTTAPIGNPRNMAVTMEVRRLAGTFSAVRAVMQGIAPPRPRPASKR
ncbi:hypothetical protein D9M70_573020 [compost metagenome]